MAPQWTHTSSLPMLRTACVLLGCVAIAQGDEGRLACYTQRVTLQFDDAESARRASVAITPLFDGHHRAVSCRWDDNWTSDNQKTRDVMEEHGIRGTWYLNDRRFSPQDGNEDYLEVAKSLLPGGNSIGSHSLTHPFLTYYHANRMFQEMAGCRIVWEAALDRPVTSYAFSFVDVRPEPEDRAVTVRMLDTLRRAGYHHIAEYVGFFDGIDLPLELSPILPPENEPFEAYQKAAKWAYDDPQLTEHHPMLSNSMHAWYETPFLNESYDELRRRFDLLTALQNVWHCNQNEYAAYRRQFHAARITETDIQGSKVTLSLERPRLRDLNDPTPLTLSIRGVAPSSVLSFACPTASIVPSERRQDESRMFHLHHDRDQSLPTTIGWVANPDNASDGLQTDPEGDFPWLRGLLTAQQGKLSLALEHDADAPLSDLQITWRTPFHWRAEPATHQAEPLAPGQRTVFETSLQALHERRSHLGNAYYAAEVDFRCGEETGRLFFTCQRSGKKPDDSWPREGFSVLGPLQEASFDRDRFLRQVESSACPEEWPTPNGPASWRGDARDGYLTHEWLNPDYVRTMGTWDAQSSTYALRSKVMAPAARTARLITSHATECDVIVNGQRMYENEVALLEGENELVILYPAAKLNPATTRLAACFVRLEDPRTGKRMKDIEYVAY